MNGSTTPEQWRELRRRLPAIRAAATTAAQCRGQAADDLGLVLLALVLAVDQQDGEALARLAHAVGGDDQ